MADAISGKAVATRKTLLKEAVWVLIGHGFGVLGALFSVRVLTELLQPAEYGMLALALTITGVANQTMFGPLGNGVSRFFSIAMDRADVATYMKATVQIAVALTLAITAFALVVSGGFAWAGYGNWALFFGGGLAFAIATGWGSLFNALQSAERRRLVVALHQGAEPWLRLLAASATIYCLGASGVVALFGYCIASLTVLVSQSLLARRVLRGAFVNFTGLTTTADWRSQMFRYAWPFTLWGGFSWLHQSSDRWALNTYDGSSEVGHFAVLYQLGFYPMSLAVGVLMQLCSPILFARAGDATDAKRNSAASKLAISITLVAGAGTIFAFLIALLWHTKIFGIFVADEYSSASYLLPWMLLAGGCFAIGQTVTLLFMSRLDTSSMVPGKIAVALFGIAMNVAGAAMWGVDGVVGAAVLGALLHVVWMIFLAKARSII